MSALPLNEEVIAYIGIRRYCTAGWVGLKVSTRELRPCLI